ncbi:MAG: DNRLRE domain-containing protein [Kineosporiaceae bacterium]|nr:DNRLRE domain-containing protein [Aeromicrobium sp.]
MAIDRPSLRTRALSLVAFVSLIAALTSASPVFADESVPDATSSVVAEPADSDGDGVLDAPNTVAAASDAQSAGEPVEDLSQRTESATVVANPDGTWTSKDFGDPVRIKRDGEWVDVDYTLEKQSDGSWAPKASPVDVSIDGGSTKEAARVTFDDGESLAVTWPTDLPEPTIDGGVATYKLSDASDLIVAVTGNGVNARIRLNEQPAEDDPVFTLGLRADGVDVTESGGGLKIQDESGKTLGGTSTLVAWDARTDDAGSPVEVVPLEASLDEVSQSGDVTKQELELSTPAGFLSDPATQYPVVIDPDISSLTRLRDTWVRMDDTTSRGADYNLFVGKINGASNANAAQSYIQFDNTAIAGKDIISAELGLYQYWAYTCSDKRMNAYPIAAAWNTGFTYPDRPSVLAVGDSTYVNANRGTTGCADGWTTLNITNMTEAWAGGEYTNNGIRLTADDPNLSSYERRFCSSNPDTSTSVCNTATRRPNMSVTYNSYPNTASALSATVDGAQVTVRANASDPDGGDVRARFVVKNGATTIFDGLSEYLASGQQAIKELPDLTNGTYTVQAWANDGSLSSKIASTVGTFTVASGAPGPFTLVSSTQAGTFTLGGGSEETVQITGLAGIPSAATAGRALLTMRATNWSASGGVSVYDTEGEEPGNADLGFNTSMNPGTGTSTASIFDLSSEGKVTVLNHGSDPVTVQLSVQGWFPLGAARPQLRDVPTDEGPPEESDGRLTPAARLIQQNQLPGSVDFPIPLETGQTMVMAGGIPTVKDSGGATVGLFHLVIFDDTGAEVAGSVSLSGTSIIVSIPSASTSSWPLHVLPVFDDESQE